jgi:hypothetical protein
MTGPEIVTFTSIVSSAFVEHELSTLLKKLNKNFLDYVPANVPYPKQVEELVGAANSKGWISQLVLAVLDDRPNNQFIKDFLSKHPYWDPANHPPLKHPADTLRILGGRSFIGRDRLRAVVKKMDTPTGKKVLLVKSTHRKVGKTYSKDLLDFVSKKLQPSGVAYVDLDFEDFDPIKLAKKLAKEMKLNTSLFPDSATEQAPRSNQELVSLLTESSPNPANPPPNWWMVLDGFRDRQPSEAIQDFIAQLAQRVQQTEEYRLILANYGCLLPLTVGEFVFTLDLEPLTRTELETHFTNVHRQKNQTNPTAAELSDYLSGMDVAFARLTQLYPDSKDDQTLVNSAVTTVVDTIEEDVV